MGNTCELCGQPATCYVADSREIETGDKWRRFEVASTHYFCNNHNRESKTDWKYAPQGKD